MHDGYNDTSFEAFLSTLPKAKGGYFDNRYMDNAMKNINSIVPINESLNIKQPTTLIAKILTIAKVIRPYIYTSTFNKIKSRRELKNKFETRLRESITELFGYDMTNIPSGFTSPIINTGKKYMVLLDMESDVKNLSDTIRESKNLNSYITTASLIDPGRHKLKHYVISKNVIALRSWLTSQVQNLDYKTRYHVGPINMILKDKSGRTFLNVKLAINLRGIKQTNIANISNDSFFTLTLNNKEVTIKTTSGNARAGGLEENMGKFMGDALQYMTVIVQNNTRNRDRVFASGDGNACFMYTHLCNCIGQKPRIIIDKTTSVAYHGLD